MYIHEILQHYLLVSRKKQVKFHVRRYSHFNGKKGVVSWLKHRICCETPHNLICCVVEWSFSLNTSQNSVASIPRAYDAMSLLVGSHNSWKFMYKFPSRKYIGTYNKTIIFRVPKKYNSLFKILLTTCASVWPLT